MRSLMSVALLGLAIGCTPPASHFVIADGRRVEIDELLRTHALAPGANIRADEIARTVGSTLHLVQVNGGETPHHHATHDLTVMVVRGQGVLTVDGLRRMMAAGDVAQVARGSVHHFVRSGGVPAVALVVFSPPLEAPDVVPEPPGVDSPASAR